jgi:NAD(P)-dependent dehydrogenase (short-subunit alcohol dehydrogenase family)
MENTVYTLVTGASSGIGRSAAVLLSRERNLIMHGRNKERLEETLGMCFSPERHIIWQFDLNNTSELAASLTFLLAAANRSVEAFVHCAGMVTVLPMRSIDYCISQKIMNVNFFSALEIVRVLLKKKDNNERLTNILFISSIFSRFGARGHSVYCASKAALDGMMRALAVELAPTVRVNSILPGAIRTQMSAKVFDDPCILEKLERDYPMGIGKPDNIADTIDFVLSDKAHWLTGQGIVVDGGRTVNMSLK